MEFTIREKRIIVQAIESEADELIDIADNYTTGATLGVKYEGEIAKSVISVVKELESIFSIQKKNY